MNGTMELNKSINDDIMVSIHFVDGDTFNQPFPLENADQVQNILDWFRKPGKDKVYSLHVEFTKQIHSFHHSKIMAIDIEGYIEPDGRNSRWYERIIDRIRILFIR